MRLVVVVSHVVVRIETDVEGVVYGMVGAVVFRKLKAVVVDHVEDCLGAVLDDQVPVSV